MYPVVENAVYKPERRVLLFHAQTIWNSRLHSLHPALLGWWDCGAISRCSDILIYLSRDRSNEAVPRYQATFLDDTLLI